MVVQELISGSGRLNSIVMMKKKGKWKEIMTIFGGFIFKPVPAKIHDLVVYVRSGADQYRVEYRFNGHS